LTVVLSQRALFDWHHHHADTGHASLTFEMFMTTPMPNSCIVAKRYIIHYLQPAVFTLFEESVKCHRFHIEALRYNKTNRDLSYLIIIEFFPSVCNMLPSIFDLRQHITNFGSKIFNNELDASHYLYTC